MVISARYLLIALPLIFAAESQSATRRVPLQYPTIQAALDASTPWDTVLVAPGVYSDTSTVLVDGAPKVVNAHITSSVYLVAEDPGQQTHIDGSASDVAIFVDNASCEIHGFEITTTFELFGCVSGQQSGVETAQLVDDVGVRCDDGTVRIVGCRIHDHACGVRLNSAIGFVECCEFYRSPAGVESLGSPYTEVEDSEFRAVGEMVFGKQSLLFVTNNKFYREEFSCTAIGLIESEATIAGNSIESLMVQGIVCGYSTALIESNTISDCRVGIVTTLADSVMVRNNLFLGNSAGMDIRATWGSIVENNTFADGGTAIIVQSNASDPLIQNNIIYNHFGGIACTFSPSPTITCNNIFNTTQPYFGDCTDHTGIDGNFSMEPQFCAPANGDFTLQVDSPCAPGNHPDGADCGLIGAFGVVCQDVPTAKTSWGSLKARYLKNDKRE